MAGTNRLDAPLPERVDPLFRAEATNPQKVASGGHVPIEIWLFNIDAVGYNGQLPLRLRALSPPPG